MAVRIIHHVAETWRKHERQHPDSYFDPNLLAQERRHLFGKRPLYVGHHDFVARENDYCVLPATNNELVLTFRDGERHLLVNSCAHAGAVLLGPGRGKKDMFISRKRGERAYYWRKKSKKIDP